MRKIGIIGAMENEITDLKKATKNAQITNKAGMEFCEGILQGRKVVIVKSGLGKVNAAVCTQILVDDFKINAVINTGMAGSLSNDIEIGDIVVSTDVLHHDMDAVGFGYELGQVPQMDAFSFQADKKFIKLAEEICRKVNPDINVFCGRILSGDQFIADKATKSRLLKNFGGICAEMEGVAIAHTAYLNNIPFVIIRTVSDKADCSTNEYHANFQSEAAKHCVRLVKELVKNY